MTIAPCPDFDRDCECAQCDAYAAEMVCPSCGAEGSCAPGRCVEDLCTECRGHGCFDSRGPVYPACNACRGTGARAAQEDER